MRPAAPVLLLSLFLLPAPALAQGSDPLANWVRFRKPDVARSDESVLRWRRFHADLPARLLALAGDAEAEFAVRRGAIFVLGAVADSGAALAGLRALETDPALGDPARQAAARVQARMRVLDVVAERAEAADAAPGSAEADALRAVARALPAEDARELLTLAADPLFDAQTPDKPRRCVAARLLGWTAGEGSPAVLTRVARDARAGSAVRRACLRALAARGLDKHLATVVVDLGGRPFDWDLLRAGLALLEPPSVGFRVALQKLLADGAASPELQVALAEDLAARGATSAAPALAELAETRRGFDRSEHLALARALGRLDLARVDPHVPQLVDYALASDDALATAAVEALLELRPTRTSEILKDLLTRPDPGGALRVRVLQLIELLGLRRMTTSVSELLAEASVPWSARQAAAHALGTLGDSEGVMALASALQDTPGRGDAAALRREAADALGASTARTDNGRLALESALLDPEPTVRRAALRGLAAYGDARSRPSLIALLGRPSTSPREAQARLSTCTRLAMFDPEIARPLLDSWGPGQRTANRDADTALAVVAYARHLTPDLAVPTLLDLLAHEAPSAGRAALAELLRRYAQADGDFGYSAATGTSARRRAIDRWRAAWKDDAEGFR